ncbi:MAG: site-2 protease family protein [Clostridia bacterium]|nr:site-2 protease family protein [Clostridia bacterium]
MKKINKYALFSPLFIIVCILILYFGNFKYFAIYSCVVTLHELAHFFVSKKLGYKLNKIYIMPYGICLNYEDNVFNGNDELHIALAGPLLNLLICFICVTIWWLFPETYYYLDYFCFCNLLLATFNLLPCFPLDGGRAFLAILSKKYDREKIFKVSIILNYAVSLFLVIMFIISIFKNINYSYIILAIFLFSGAVNPNKYSSYNYLSLSVNRKNLLNNGANIKITAFDGNVPIYKMISKFSKYKYNIVYIVLNDGSVKVVTEKTINYYALKFSPSFTFNQILSFIRN